MAALTTHRWRSAILGVAAAAMLALVALVADPPAFARTPAALRRRGTDGSTTSGRIPMRSQQRSYATETGEVDVEATKTFGFGIRPTRHSGVTVNVEANILGPSGCGIASECARRGTRIEGPPTLTGIVDAVYTLGGATDTWGANWTVATSPTHVPRGGRDRRRRAGCWSGAAVSHDRIEVQVHYVPAPNPELTESCGLDIALVMDTSGSIDDTELGQVKTAFNGFVDALLPATPTEFALVRFDDDAAVLQAFTGDNATITAAITAANGDGSTNWEAGLDTAGGLFPHRAKPDLIVFASDGNPTESAGPLDDLSDAVVEANAIKGAGIRIVTLGIGDDVDTDNLTAISGPDAVYTGGFGDLADNLAALANELCGGTLTITKTIDGVNAPNAALAGWQFAVTGASTQTTDNTGVAGPVDLTDGPGNATVSVSETVKAGYAFAGATCVKQDGPDAGTEPDPITVTATATGLTGLSIGPDDIVNCTFQNRALTAEGPFGNATCTDTIDNDGDGLIDAADPECAAPTGTLTVTKTYVGGGLAPQVTIAVDCTGAADPASEETVGLSASFTITDLTSTPTCTATETEPAGYLQTDTTCTSVAMTAGQTSTCTITNTRDQDDDGDIDTQDNCVTTANPNQSDVDTDQIGDLCDTETGTAGVGDAATASTTMATAPSTSSIRAAWRPRARSRWRRKSSRTAASTCSTCSSTVCCSATTSATISRPRRSSSMLARTRSARDRAGEQPLRLHDDSPVATSTTRTTRNSPLPVRRVIRPCTRLTWRLARTSSAR